MAETGQKPEQSPTPPEKPANRPVIAVNQLGLWYFHQLSPSSAVYNVPFRVRLEGAVDADVLAQAVPGVAASPPASAGTVYRFGSG